MKSLDALNIQTISQTTLATTKIDADTERLTFVVGAVRGPHPISVLFTDGGR